MLGRVVLKPACASLKISCFFCICYKITEAINFSHCGSKLTPM